MPFVPNKRDQVQSPLFDTYTIGAAATPTTIQMFVAPISSSKGPELTNMTKAGELPPPQKFTVFGLSFSCIGIALADFEKLLKQYTAKLIVGSKEYLGGPLDFFPATGGSYGQTTATTTTILTNGLPTQAGAFAIAPEYAVTIESGERFEVDLVGSTFTPAATGLFIRAYLLGVWERGVQ